VDFTDPSAALALLGIGLLDAGSAAWLGWLTLGGPSSS
jgi:hypothetical protein